MWCKTLDLFFRLHEAYEAGLLNKYIMWVWSDNFTFAFFVGFIVTAFVPDIEGIQKHCNTFMNGNNLFSEWNEHV